MTAIEIITVIAILAGPVLAVAVQLRAERRKQHRDAQTTTFRLLVGTRHLPSDPGYSTAINMIPIDFDRVSSVIAAHKKYIETITYTPSPENVVAHNQQIIANQTKQVFEMARHLGYDLSETEIQNSAYAAGGFIQRDNLMLDSWRAWQRIATALETQANWISAQNNSEIQ